MRCDLIHISCVLITIHFQTYGNFSSSVCLFTNSNIGDQSTNTLCVFFFFFPLADLLVFVDLFICNILHQTATWSRFSWSWLKVRGICIGRKLRQQVSLLIFVIFFFFFDRRLRSRQCERGTKRVYMWRKKNVIAPRCRCTRIIGHAKHFYHWKWKKTN